ncbi:hypothetical protein ABS71_02650 [bacterium SCN 62-11]|nr:hypothetical protein [Candidatus Eremiobacteraeota bacterium]ODT77282.1 MAG: hypothetical protein ABS71_02650 [bacterium SCN 62-11]
MLKKIVPLMALFALQAGADPLRYGFVPVRFTGDYQPVSAADFMTSLRAEVQKKAPNLNVVLVDAPEVAHWSDMLPPDPNQIKALTKRLGVDRLAWGSIKLSTESKLMRTGGGANPGDLFPGQTPGTYRYIITVAGAADINVADGASGKILLDEPFAIFGSESTSAAEGTTRFDDVEKQLTLQCSEDLADQIVRQAKREVQP